MLKYLIILIIMINSFLSKAEGTKSSEEIINFIRSKGIFEECKKIFNDEFLSLNNQNNFNYKKDGSLVSRLEKSIEKKIGLFLKKKTPKIGFIGEEGYKYIPSQEKNNMFWYIDPIDGTISFKNNLDTFGLTLTLVSNKEPIATLIYFPKLNITYTAYLNQGAYKNGNLFKTPDAEINKYNIIAYSDDYAFSLTKRECFLNTLKKLPYITRSYTDIYAYTLVAEG